MRAYFPEIEVLIDSVSDTFTPTVSYGAALVLKFRFKRYSDDPLRIDNFTATYIHDGKETDFVIEYDDCLIDIISVPDRISDEIECRIPMTSIQNRKISEGDKIRFKFNRTNSDHQISKAVILMSYDGNSWFEETNYSPVLKSERFATCDITLFDNDDLSLKLIGVGFEGDHMDYFFTSQNFTSTSLSLWLCELRLSVNQNGNISLYGEEYSESDYIGTLDPCATANFVYSLKDRPWRYFNRNILTEMLEDPQNFKATASFNIVYDIEGEFSHLGDVSKIVTHELSSAPKAPYLEDSVFSYLPDSRLPTEPEQILSEQTLTYKDFLIYANNLKCAYNHETHTVIAVVDLARPDGTVEHEKINAAYCSTCNIYYILEYNYKRLREKGNILCQQLSLNQWYEYNTPSSYNNLNAQSRLKLLGYNVDSKIGLTTAQRHTLLKRVIDNGTYSKEEILSFLSWIIRYNTNNPKFTNAIPKWQTDLDFVTDYYPGECPEVGVKSLKQTIYHKK